jgi:hypothetical protein
MQQQVTGKTDVSRLSEEARPGESGPAEAWKTRRLRRSEVQNLVTARVCSQYAQTSEVKFRGDLPENILNCCRSHPHGISSSHAPVLKEIPIC